MVSRLERFHGSLQASAFDAVVITSPENVLYLTGADIHTQRTIPERLAAVVWIKDCRPTFVVCNLEEAQARSESRISDVRVYVEFKESPATIVAQVLQEQGAVGGRVGVEARHLITRFYLELRELLPEADLAGCDALLDRIRVLKDEAEITLLEKAARATDRTIWQVFASAQVGITEAEMARRLKVELLDAGADSVAFQVMAAAANGCMTHPVPGPYQLQAGDVTRTDFGGTFNGYYSDLARTAVVSKASQEQRDIYAFIWNVHEQLIAQMRPGTAMCEIYELCRRLYLDAGYSFARPHIGHSLGLTVHEYPLFNPYAKEELEPGMVVCIEPNHLVPGVGKYHVEDTILITEAAPRVLSRTADWSELMVIDPL